MSINYAGLRRAENSQRISQRLLRLREHALAPVLASRDDHSVLIATWNLRDFDGPKFGWSKRTDESMYYIAEIISAFDLVAIQEVKQDLAPFEHLVETLGRNEWDYLLTDSNRGGSGNGERMAFVFRRSTVWFRKVAGEVVLPTGQEIVDPAEVDPQKVAAAHTLTTATSETIESELASAPATDPDGSQEGRRLQFARSPYLVAFQAGWFRFSLCTVHIYYGADSGPELLRRIEEIRALVSYFADKQDAEIKTARDARKAAGLPVERPGCDPGVENYMLLGDFNVVSPDHQTMQALQSQGFEVPAAIDGDALDASMREHFYDQIAARIKDDRFHVTQGGVVRMFDDVYTDDDVDLYGPQLPTRDPESGAKAGGKGPQESREAVYGKWRTWQMSDHCPLWVKIETDFTEDYLRALADA